MPEVLGNPPSPRTALLWNGTAWQWALVDAAGHLQIDTLSTVMDALAATAANQVLMLAQLQLIEDMRDALESVATDRLIVRGEDQLFSIEQNVLNSGTGVISGAGGYFESGAVPNGRYWVITNIYAWDATTATTEARYYRRFAGGNWWFHKEIAAMAANQGTWWNGRLFLPATATIRIQMIGSLIGDTGGILTSGYQMTVE